MQKLFVMLFLLFLFVHSLPMDAQENRGKPATIEVKGSVVSLIVGV